MQVAVDISLYPLADDFLPPIQDFIQHLNEYKSIEVLTNPMSTQIRGEYDDVMAALTEAMKKTFEETPKAVFATRILNNPMQA